MNDKDELYTEITRVVNPVVTFITGLDDTFAVRACIVYSILSLVGPLDPTEALGIIERSKFQLMKSLERDDDKQPNDQFSFIS